MKNRRWHRGIKRSPYEAMFGKKMKMGNEDNIIPTEEERGIEDENDENEAIFTNLIEILYLNFEFCSPVK